MLRTMNTTKENAAVQHYGSLRAVARELGISHSALCRRLERSRPLLTAEDAVALETASQGALRRSQLRPDLWPEEAPT